jgi:hypothetical protein
MSTLRFHKELYSGMAVDAAMKRFERFATFELADEQGYWSVEVQATRPEHQLQIERELGNFALGLTIERGGPDGAEDSGG